MMFQLFKPAPHIERLDDSKTDAAYKRLRLQVFLGIFIGYAGYYLLRKNFAFAIPYFQEQGFSKGTWLGACGRINRLRLQQIYYGDGV